MRHRSTAGYVFWGKEAESGKRKIFISPWFFKLSWLQKGGKREHVQVGSGGLD